MKNDKFIDLDVIVADDDPLSLESCCGMLNDFGMNEHIAKPLDMKKLARSLERWLQ